MIEQGAEKFEKDSLVVFEMLLQGYKKAKESNVWESNMDGLVEKMTQYPTAPFPVRLMELFDFDYLVMSHSIENIIKKSLVIREQMEHTQRSITIDEKYYSRPFLQPNTYLKSLKIYNAEGELCYREKGKIRIRHTKFLKWIFSGMNNDKFKKVVHYKQSSMEVQPLEIYYYSEFINLSVTDPVAYYNFFCDYHGKIKFLNYIKANSDISLSSTIYTDTRTIRNFSSLGQVLWAYFVFDVIGLKLRENLDASTLTKFLHIINNLNIDDYKNSYFYKLAGKVPHIKSKNLLEELEALKKYFRKKNFPTHEVENVISKIKK